MSAISNLSGSQRSRLSGAVALALGASMLLGPGSAFAQSAPPAAQPTPPPTMAPMPPPPPPGAQPTAPGQPLPPAAGQPGAAPPPAAGPMPPAGPVAAPPTDPAEGPEAPTGYVPPADAQADNSKLPAYIAFGVAGASLIAGTALGIAALAAKSDYDDKAKNDPAGAQELANKVDDRALLADTFFGAALVAGLSGAIVYFIDPKPAAPAAGAPAASKRTTKTQTGFSLAPIASPRAQGAAFTLRF